MRPCLKTSKKFFSHCLKTILGVFVLIKIFHSVNVLLEKATSMKIKKFTKNQSSALMLRVSRALRALLLYVSRALRALLLYVARALHALLLYVARKLASLVAFCLTCFLPYVG